MNKQPNWLLMSSRFWQMDCPEQADNTTTLNVDMEHPFGLPGVDSPVCGHTWGGTRVLLVPCPPRFQNHPNVRDRWPIPLAEHLTLRSQISAALARSGYAVPELRPGDSFQPGQVGLRSRPQCDFLWPKPWSRLVSQQVKDLFEQQRVSGVAFCPVPIIRPRRPSIERLYEMVIVAESGRPPGTEITHVCPTCGREEFDRSKRQFVLTPEMIPTADVFYLATTLWIIVNQKVHDLIMGSGLTNVQLQPMEYRGRSGLAPGA
jgi:hypothetical protein